MIDLGSAIGKIAIDAADALKTTDGLGRALSGLTGPAGTMAAGIAAGAAAAGGALIALGASSVGVATEFQSSMAIMSTAVDPASLGLETTADAMAVLGDAALAVGGDTDLVGVSASTSAEAMTGLYKAGLSTGEIFGDLQGYLAGTAELGGALRASIDLAAASELDMVQASELAAVTLATFGGHLETEAERAEFINSAMNNFVQTADGSVASVADLQAAFVNVGPSAAAMGMGVEEVNTALGILSTRGIVGSEAGTALKSMMTNMMRDTPAVTGALKELGISLYDVDGNMRPLPDIISQFDSALNGTREVMVTVGGRTEEQNRQLELAMNAYDQATEAIYKHESGLKVLSENGLEKVQSQQAAANSEIERLQSIVGDTTVALQDMTQEQRNQYIATIAGTYGMNAMNALLGEGTEGWAAMEGAIGNAATMQETAAARTNTLAGAQEALSGVFETFRIKVGTALIPVLTSLADIGASLLEKYGPAMTAVFEDVGDFFSGLFAELEKGAGPIDAIFEAFLNWTKVGENLSPKAYEFFLNLHEGISNVVTAIRNLITPVAEFVSSHGPQLRQVLLGIGVALAAFTIIGTVVGWVSSLAAVIGGLAATFTAAGGGIAGLVALLGGPLTVVIGAIAAAIGVLAVAWRNDWGGIQEKVQTVAAALGVVFETIKGVIQGFMANLSEGMSPLNAFIEAIWGIVPQPVLDALVNLRDNVLPSLMATFQTVWGLIQTVIGTAVEAIRPAIEQIITTAQGAGTKLQELAGPLQGLWAKVGPFIQTAATVIGGILTALVGVIGGILTALVGVIVGIVNGIAAALDPLIDTFVAVAENVIQIVGGIIDFIGGFLNLVIGLVTGNGEKVKAAFSQMWEGVKDIVGGLVDGVWELFSGLVETVATLIDGFITGIIEFFQNLYDELVGHSIVVDLIESIVEWFENLITWIGDALGGLWNAVIEPFIQMWDDLKAWFAEKVTEAIQLGKDIIGGIVQGLQAVGHMITQTIMSFMQAAWDQITSFWELGSPSKRMNRLGVDIVKGLNEGITESTPLAVAALEEMGDEMGAALASMVETLGDPVAEMNALFSNMGNVSSLGGGFSRFFEQQTLEPLRDGVAAMEEQLSDWDSAMQDIVRQLGYGEDFLMTPGAELELNRLINYEHATQQQRDQARTLLAFMRERNRMQGDYLALQEQLAAEENRLLLFQERQRENAFLQEQLKLLQLFRENNLDTSILDGLELGLNADVGAIMDAMRAALTQMIAAAQNALGIHSPSAVFRRIGEQVNAGLLKGLLDNRPIIEAVQETVDSITRPIAESIQPSEALHSAVSAINRPIAATLQDAMRAINRSVMASVWQNTIGPINRPVIEAMRDTMDSLAARAYATAIPVPATADGRTAHLYGGQHFYFQQPRGSMLDDVQLLLAP